MSNGSHISDGGQAEIRFNPAGNVGAVERGGIKTAPGGSPFFDLNAKVNIDADEYIKTLDAISEKTDALIVKTERLVALMREAGRGIPDGGN